MLTVKMKNKKEFNQKKKMKEKKAHVTQNLAVSVSLGQGGAPLRHVRHGTRSL